MKGGDGVLFSSFSIFLVFPKFSLNLSTYHNSFGWLEAKVILCLKLLESLTHFRGLNQNFSRYRAPKKARHGSGVTDVDTEETKKSLKESILGASLLLADGMICFRKKD